MTHLKIVPDKSIRIVTEELSTFGNRLKQARSELQMLEKDFALRLNVSDDFLKELEEGKVTPGYELLRKLYTTYKINLHYLIEGDGEAFVDKENLHVLNPDYIKPPKIMPDEIRYQLEISCHEEDKSRLKS
jgi:transcriptional regulator with XRE-family HTH domain